MTEYEIDTVKEQYKKKIKHTHRNYLIQMIITIGLAAGLGFEVLKNGLYSELTDIERLILLLGIAAVAGFIIIKCNRAGIVHAIDEQLSSRRPCCICLYKNNGNGYYYRH